MYVCAVASRPSRWYIGVLHIDEASTEKGIRASFDILPVWIPVSDRYRQGMLQQNMLRQNAV